MSYQSTFLVLLATLFLASAVDAQLVTQTMDGPLSYRPVDGLVLQGVTYSYTLDGVHSDDAKYNSFGPIMTDATEDPSIIGTARGILTIDFELATPVIEVGVAISDTGPLTPGFTVELFDELLASMATIPVDTAPASALGFSDALFQYEGAPVGRMVIDFADEPDSFAVDNLVYQVPEPTSAFGLLSLALMAAVVRRSSD